MPGPYWSARATAEKPCRSTLRPTVTATGLRTEARREPRPDSLPPEPRPDSRRLTARRVRTSHPGSTPRASAVVNGTQPGNGPAQTLLPTLEGQCPRPPPGTCWEQQDQEAKPPLLGPVGLLNGVGVEPVVQFACRTKHGREAGLPAQSCGGGEPLLQLVEQTGNRGSQGEFGTSARGRNTQVRWSPHSPLKRASQVRILPGAPAQRPRTDGPGLRHPCSTSTPLVNDVRGAS